MEIYKKNGFMEYASKIEHKMVLLTPQMANDLLLVNYENNRDLNKTHINNIARSIQLGEYNPYMINQELAVSDAGHLMDGQHRCFAVIQCGIAIPAMIAYNVPEEWFPQFDRGLSRKAGDYIDCKNKNVIISIANYAICIENGATFSNAIKGIVSGKYKGGLVKPTREETIDYFNDNRQDLEYFAGLGLRLNKSLLGGGGAAYSKPLWLINYLSNGKDRDMIEHFVKMVEEDDGSIPVIRFFKTTIAQKQLVALKNHTHLDTRYIHDLVLVCYNRFAATGEVPRGRVFDDVIGRYASAVLSNANIKNCNVSYRMD